MQSITIFYSKLSLLTPHSQLVTIKISIIGLRHTILY